MLFKVTIAPPSRQSDLGQDISPSSDYESLVMEACEVLGETDCQFSVSGFGEIAWPVSVSYDLSTLMEQIPEALTDLKNGHETEIDFYGQGVERTVSWTPRGAEMVLRCDSRTAWKPQPSEERHPREAGERILIKAYEDFTLALQTASPRMAALLPPLP